MALDEGLSKKIMDVLREADPLDLSIEEVAKKSGIHRNTVAKYLAVLSAEGKVKLRSLGKAKLYRPVKVDTLHAMKSPRGGQHEIAGCGSSQTR